MKTLNMNKLIALLLVAFTVAACVQDDEYDVPNVEATPLNIPANQKTTIDAVKAALLQEIANNGNQTLTFDTDLFMEGYVISNDQTGNFFEELLLQDKPNAPTSGVKVLIDSNPLFSRFEFGRKVFVSLNGLTVGFDSGVLTLGFENAGTVDPISEAKMLDFVLRDSMVAEITPLEIGFENFSDDLTNLYVRLNNVQFNRNQALGDDALTYSGEETDEFDGERILESCATGASTIFSTSTFADFSSVKLAQGRGYIDGILTYDFFGDYYIVSVNSLDDIHLDETNRCDPDVFACDGPSGGGTAFYTQNFEQFNAIEDYENAGWTNVNVSGGNTLWVIGNFNNSNYAQISGFNTGESTIETWLVTPAIDMDNTTEEELFMDIQTNFDNGKILSVLFSNNFTGDVTTATWQPLDVTIPSGPADTFGDFETVGPVNISCIEGTMHLAFLYEGSDPNATTRYHIDNIEITGN